MKTFSGMNEDCGFCCKFAHYMINRLKVVLAEKNRTGKWLAQQLGKNEATVSRWCSNTAQPSLEMVIKIASVLKIDPRRLINGGTSIQQWK